jgi:O-antigen/teichoic acid export membrane protein
MSIKKNFLHNILYILSNILFPIVSFSYSSRIIGPEGIGKVQFVITFAQYFVMVAALGIPVYGILEVAKARGDQDRLNKLFSELLFINILTSLFLLLIYITIISVVGWFHGDSVFYILGGILVLFGFSTLDWFYVGTEQFQFLSIRSIIIKVLALIALFLFVKNSNDLIVFFLITVFSILGNNIWNLINLKGQVILRFKQLSLRKHLPVLITLFSTSIAISIYTLVDTLLLGFLADDRAVGFYTAAIKITKLAIPLVASMGTVLIPRITQSIDTNNNQVTQSLTDKSFSFICLLGVPISFGLFIYSPEILMVFSGNQFMDATLTMQIASPLVFLIGLGSIFGSQLLIPSGNEKGYLVATIFGLVISLILNLTLIGAFRDKGTAFATVCSEFVVSSISFLYVKRKMDLRFNWGLALKAGLACLLFMPVAFVVRGIWVSEFVRLGVEVIVCAVGYFLVQGFVFKEVLVRGVVLEILKKGRDFSLHSK